MAQKGEAMRMTFIGPSEAALTASQICLYVAGFSSRTVRSTTDTSATGTRKLMPEGQTVETHGI